MLNQFRTLLFMGALCLLVACGGADDEDSSSGSSSSGSSSSSSSSSSSNSSSGAEAFEFDPVVVLAINAGGGEFSGADGIEYSADEHFQAGNQYSTTQAISGTEDDELYQSERYNTDDLVYEIPLSNGVYDVRLKFAEIYQDAPGTRVINVTIESSTLTQNLDIVQAAGPLSAHDVDYHGISVNDGNLSISLSASVDNPKLSGIVVYREPTGGDIYKQQCQGCHGNEKGENFVAGGPLTQSECRACGSLDTLASFIDIAMPDGKPGWCKGQCSIDVATYILENFAGFNGIPEEQPDDSVPIAGDLQACQNGINTTFGGLRRITKIEYKNLVFQLFGEDRDFSTSFGKDGKLGNFNVNVELPISELQTDQFLEVGESIAISAANNLGRWAPCTSQDSNCVSQIIDQVVSRAYRRPLTTSDKNRLLAIYNNTSSDFRTKLATMLEAVLSSPNFLYHLEFGDSNNSLGNGVVPLTSHEIAARLSFFLWRSAPDSILLQEAAANRLQTKAQIETQARRMLEDPRAKVAVGIFHKEWMRLEDPEPGKPNEDQLRANIEDTVRTVVELTYTDNGMLEDLFHVSYGYLNDDTKSLYGVNSNPIAFGSDGYDKYQLNTAQRGGILSRAGFLSFNTPPSGRGKFIREQVLCGVIPPPPADFVPEVPEGDPSQPPRMRWIEHVSNPSCGGCHSLMDPLGFGFDNYDEEGHWRTMIGDWPVDATGEIVETSDINGNFDGARELQSILATSADTKACYSLQWFRFGVGRQPGMEDSCALAELNQIAAANNYNIREVMIALTQTDAFRYRRAEPTQ